MRLVDKVSIITGAGSGIGHATAVKFAKDVRLVHTIQDWSSDQRWVTGKDDQPAFFRVEHDAHMRRPLPDNPHARVLIDDDRVAVLSVDPMTLRHWITGALRAGGAAMDGSLKDESGTEQHDNSVQLIIQTFVSIRVGDRIAPRRG